ncbi:Aste57867_3022 [Aphanomyces stellatus]|uniref:Aste57867_3022 protein n=1 Tax=Aphanomyces stellatus TaxID=120398 RepID=A0A485KEI8_9STRA|nr:hypothetical protein As57867_003013 [Aphanomyces stellatus]VFT80202.1 Aste57867_3022 [Aphanomyces stellatus]
MHRYGGVNTMGVCNMDCPEGSGTHCLRHLPSTATTSSTAATVACEIFWCQFSLFVTSNQKGLTYTYVNVFLHAGIKRTSFAQREKGTMPSYMDRAAMSIDYIAASSFRIGVFTVFQTVVFLALQLLLAVFVYGPASVAGAPDTPFLPIPDARFGYDAQDLVELYLWMGPAVRRNFLVFELVDLLVFLPTYTHFLTLLLALVFSRLGRPHEPSLVVYVPFVAGMFDALENAAHLYTAATFQPARSIQKETWLHAAVVGSLCNQAKWTFIAISLVVLCWTYGKTTMLDSTPEEEGNDVAASDESSTSDDDVFVDYASQKKMQ